MWLALGENREYLIYPKLYCSCLNFYKEVVINQSIGYCKHLITQVICGRANS
ncbi:unnamed protein product, partial [marine sediment metagenome]